MTPAQPMHLPSRSVCIRLAVTALALAPVSCLVSERWGEETDFIVGKNGIINSFKEPGPNPTSIVGIEKAVPKLSEENLVEIRMIAGPVRVRPAGERGPRNLEFYRRNIQTGPFGVVLTGPNAIAELSFADDTKLVLQHTSLARLGDCAAGEPRLICDRLTRIDCTNAAEPKLGPIEIPGGILIQAPPFGRFKVDLIQDRYYRVSNDGKSPIELKVDAKSYWLRPAEQIELPALRTLPKAPWSGAQVTASAEILPKANGSQPSSDSVQIGEATFQTSRVDFDALQPKVTKNSRTPGER